MKKNIMICLALSFFACQQAKKETPQKQYIYFENGTIRREFQVIDGKHEGLMTDFFPTGKRKAERYFVHDIQVGKTIIFQEDGIAIREVQYYDDKGNRIKGDTLWYANGNIEFVAQFANDKKNGILSKFDTLGELVYSADFQQDSLVKVLKGVNM